LQIFVQGGRKL